MRKNLSIALALLMLIATVPLLGACLYLPPAPAKTSRPPGHALTNSAEKHAP